MDKNNIGKQQNGKTPSEGSKPKNKRKRRKRSATGERNYVCGCGKAYLSYPALYTHVKNKHEGTFPEGSILKKLVKPEDEINDYVTAEKQSYENEVRGFLRRLEGAASDLESNDERIENDKILRNFPEEYLKELSQFKVFKQTLEKRLNDHYKNQGQVTQLINNMGNQGIKKQRNDNQKPTCDEILSDFIIEFSGFITPRFCKEFLVFVCLLRKAYNEHGGTLKSRNLRLETDDRFEKDFCTGTDIGYLPELANIFISEFFPEYYESELKNTERLIYLGLSDEVLINLIYLFKFFCNWLLINDYTVLKLEINTDP